VEITHNVVHHTYTNIHTVDEDLSVSPLLRLSPHADRHFFHRFQHWYALPLYGLYDAVLGLSSKTTRSCSGRDLGPYRDKQHDKSNVIILMTAKVLLLRVTHSSCR